MSQGIHRPIAPPPRMLAAIAAVALLVTTVLVYATFTTHRTVRSLADHDLALLDSLGTIVHLDEVLTMSARMSALSGDLRWVERYREFEPALAHEIDRALRLAPDADETGFLRRTDEANRRLVAIEESCLDLVEAGQPEAAQKNLFGPEYERLKAEYMQGALSSRRSCERRIAGNVERSRMAVLANGSAAIAGALGGFGLLLAAGRSMARREQLRHEMQVASRRSALGQLGAGLAHELNQPLSAIVNYCATARVLATQAGERAEPIAEAVERAEQQAVRAGEIIAHVRSFVRGDSMEPRPVDPTEVVRAAARLVQAEARDAGVAMRVIVRTDRTLRGDPVQLQQVLVNLIVNAIDACRDAPDGGEVVVSVFDDGAAVVIEVVDNGPGLPPAVARHPFKPFQTTKPEGLGLGLNISRGIVEAHHGSISHGTSNGRTVFRVAFNPATMAE